MFKFRGRAKFGQVLPHGQEGGKNIFNRHNRYGAGATVGDVKEDVQLCDAHAITQTSMKCFMENNYGHFQFVLYRLYEQ